MVREQTMHAKPLVALCLSVSFLSLTPAQAADAPSAGGYKPDPASVQRYGPAYRYPQAGWIVLHIEGQPYERGYQHGRLLAPEILDFLKASANIANHQTPSEGWKSVRTLVNALFLRQYEAEYLEEMKGIADGANAVGVRWENRPLDLLDIVTLNAWAEVETLDSALEALPTGLEGQVFPRQQPRAMPAPKPMHCSAFAATGPATKDGKIVFGHITMFSLYASAHFNVWLDVKPAKGHRVLMQTYPGGIQSGMDYYLNDVGLIVTETTIGQTRFDIKGQALASRIRQALQYGSSIDDAVAILSKDNNGLYTNEWLLADTKTNEIAMFELGTHKTKLYRSSKNEWFDGTPGFYWGCNNTKDRDVRLETIASVNDRPANVVYRPSDRDQMWVRLYEQYKGKIDADFGKLAFTTPPLAAYHSLDAKFTTTDMANKLETWALFGPPLGRSWQPSIEERKRFPDIKPLISNPWTILHGGAPVSSSGPVADLPQANGYHSLAEISGDQSGFAETNPAWRGTLFPATSGDIWLATAFAEYEHIVAAELARQKAHEKAGSKPSALKEAEFLAGRLYAFRSAYLSAAAIEGPTPLLSIQKRAGDNLWYRQAAGKGVLTLHALREYVGLTEFLEMMNKFGVANAGKEVTTSAFIAHCEKETGKPVGEFLKVWLRGKELPALGFAETMVTVTDTEPITSVTGQIRQSNGQSNLSVHVVVKTDKDEEIAVVQMIEGVGHFNIPTQRRPSSVMLSPADAVLCSEGGTYALSSFTEELEKTLIVYGAGDEQAINLEAAQDLQRAIIAQHSNMTIPYKSDKEVSQEELKSHHLLLIGRPDNNSVVAAMKDSLPVTFGPRSFEVQGTKYANAGSAVMAAAANPRDPRYSVVVIAGLAAEATFHAAPGLMTRGEATQVMVLPARAGAKSIVVMAAEWTKDLGPAKAPRITSAPAAGSGK
jgi:hypothetical protein